MRTSRENREVLLFWGKVMTQNIDREHPDYVARKAMWKQYNDLYAGGERLRANAAEYLIRRHREPAEVYGERLNRIFHENYIGSIIDWYAATLMRREPAVMVEGADPRAQSFYNVFSDDCNLKGTALHEFFRQRLVQILVNGRSFLAVDFPRASGPVLTRAEEDATGRSLARTERNPGRASAGHGLSSIGKQSGIMRDVEGLAWRTIAELSVGVGTVRRAYERKPISREVRQQPRAAVTA